MDNTVYNNILKTVDINLKKHRFISISGTNKCGKTTLIKTLGNLIGNDLKTSKKNMGIILSNENTFIHNTVDKVIDHYGENLEEVLKSKIIKYLVLNKLLKKKVSKLTSFEKLKLNIAVELLKKNNIILIDDIGNSLTKTEKIELFDILKRLVEEDIRIIYTTQNLDYTIYSDYLYVLDKGKIVLEGKPLLVLKEDTTLNKLGIDLPFMVDFSIKLIDYNIIESIELDIERMVNNLWK